MPTLVYVDWLFCEMGGVGSISSLSAWGMDGGGEVVLVGCGVCEEVSVGEGVAVGPKDGAVPCAGAGVECCWPNSFFRVVESIVDDVPPSHAISSLYNERGRVLDEV